MAKENNKTTTKLTPHFTLEEMTVTEVKLGYVDKIRQTQPNEQVIENLTRVCQWLEMLRERWNKLYGEGNDPVIINSGYRCQEVNRLVGGCATSPYCWTSATTCIRTSMSCSWSAKENATGSTSPYAPKTTAERFLLSM